MRYFELVDKLDTKFRPHVARGTNIRTPRGCAECSTLPQNASPPDALPIAEVPHGAMLSFTSWGFGVIARELLELLGDEGVDCLKLGQLVDAKGGVVNGFRTFVGVERVFLRGSAESQHHLCKACGVLIYTYLPRESPYLTPPQVASGRAIYEIESMQLLVNERIRERIGNRWSDALTFYEVPLLDSPLDGLPADISMWPSPSQLADYKPNPPKWVSPQS